MTQRALKFANNPQVGGQSLAGDPAREATQSLGRNAPTSHFTTRCCWVGVWLLSVAACAGDEKPALSPALPAEPMRDLVPPVEGLDAGPLEEPAIPDGGPELHDAGLALK